MDAMERDSGAARRSRSGGPARCPVRQQPVSDRNSHTKPDFYDRSVASRPRRRARRPRSRARRRAIHRTRRRPAGRRGDGAAPAQAPGGARCRRRRHRRGLVARAGDRRAQRLCLGLPGCADRFDPPAARPRRPARHRHRSRGRRPHRARHGQARRRRAQLLERHRPDPALRPRGRGACRQRPAVAAFRAGRAHAGPAHVGDLGRRLHLPHRPPAAPRPRLDAARHVGAGGRALLRERRPELGARRHDQGAPGGRQPRRRRGLPGRPHALYLAQASRLRGDPRHPFDQAPDRRPSRRQRRQGAGPQRQAGPRRHPRDRVLRPDPAADLRRTQSRAAPARRPARPCARSPPRAMSRPAPPTS